MRSVAPDTLRVLARALGGAGMITEEAASTAAVLADADLRGVCTHGTVRLGQYMYLVARGRPVVGASRRCCGGTAVWSSPDQLDLHVIR